MKLISSLLVLACASFSVSAIENDQAEAWLGKLSQSLNHLNFNTSFVVVKNNQAEPYRWFHGVTDKNVELEILALLNGPRRDVLRQGNVVSYIEPEFPPYSVNAENISSPIPTIFRGNVEELADSYNFISTGRSRVLGRVAQLIRIVSKDEHRHAYWLWLDQESNLPLKLALITRKGQLLEQVQFTHLEITEQPAESLLQLKAAELPAIVELPEEQTQEFAWAVNWLPQGFTRIKSNRHRISHTKQPVEFMLFSDGLIDVSVYVGKSEDNQRPMDFARDGGTVVLNQVVDGYEISVVGKVPSKTAKMIADSVAFIMPNP